MPTACHNIFRKTLLLVIVLLLGSLVILSVSRVAAASRRSLGNHLLRIGQHAEAKTAQNNREFVVFSIATEESVG